MELSATGRGLYCLLMARIRRITALFVTVLLAQLLLVESGFACQMPGMEQDAGGAMAASAEVVAGMDMSGMDMSGMDMSGMDMSGMDMPSSPSDTGDPSDESPCRFPWAPAGCQSMAPCGPAALAVLTPALTVPKAAPGVVLALAVLAPPSQARPPELPPPRA